MRLHSLSQPPSTTRPYPRRQLLTRALDLGDAASWVQRSSWPALHLRYACGFAADQVTFDLLDMRVRRPQLSEQT